MQTYNSKQTGVPVTTLDYCDTRSTHDWVTILQMVQCFCTFTHDWVVSSSVSVLP